MQMTGRGQQVRWMLFAAHQEITGFPVGRNLFRQCILPRD